MPLRRFLAVSAAALLLGATSACGQEANGSSGGRLDVVTAFYPLKFLAERVGGDAVRVSQLTKPGAEPHDVELTVRQVAEISDAALVVYLRGFQPAVDQAVAQRSKRGFDAGEEVELLPAGEHDHEAGEEHQEGAGHEGDEHAEGGTDPHVWLDPARYAAIADALAVRLGTIDPERAAAYTERARTLHAELDALNGEYAAKLKTCARREFVTSHTAFHYLADRYSLKEIGITGITPETEPSPQRLAEVAERAKATGATTIFFETLVSPKVAETVAREAGVGTAVLDPIEGVDESRADYFSVMRANLTALATALGCSS
ncbi:metal ABC transporter substrate-binding protein [Couchioplanes azureus]|uniref:metal ABC transporter substrate-binding protein n=1 Tax=Couchioplanes caeruleus TaxID=56438 RepID=UPI0019BF049F|nr:metal ABC transporter substrate-binding protein [Couchioplanes caeruleus]GGQ79949.1 zinc ABC transporter substrate-binding protein [Couchioplanes caeruleus subsp. azureus]